MDASLIPKHTGYLLTMSKQEPICTY